MIVLMRYKNSNVKMFKWLVAGMCVWASFQAAPARAQFFTLPTNLSTTQTDAIFKVLAADTVFRSIEPASEFGKDFGFSIGVIGNLTMGSALNAVIPGAATSFLPGGYLAATLQLPVGLALEGGFIPSLSFSSASFSSFGLNAKWTFSQLIPLMPLSAAVRLGFTSPRISYSLTSPVATTMVFTSTVVSASLMISKAFSVFEPFIGLGYYSANSTLTTTATAFFQSATNSITSNPAGVTFMAGLDIRLAFLAIGFQYENILGNDTLAGRVGVRF